jgi:flagellar biosynthesis/type III secretory pathway protein FliH
MRVICYTKMIELCVYPKPTTELDDYIRQLADNENKQRDELSKRYSVDEKELEAYERGFSEGYRCGLEDGWAKGFDEGLKQAAKEEKEQNKEDSE